MNRGYTITFTGEKSFYEEDKGKAMRYFWDEMEKIGLGTGLFVKEVNCEPFEEEEDDELDLAGCGVRFESDTQ